MRPNPFRGLASYDDGDDLYGRDADVDLVKSRLWSGRFTVLFAGSGVGKSSFLKAKLVKCLKEALGNSNVVMPKSWTAPDPAATIRKLRADIEAGTSGTSVLILDQFEEVFQTFPNASLFNAIGNELGVFSKRSYSVDVRIVVSIREEFLGELSAFEDFMPGLLANYYRLERPTIQQARSIIVNTVLMPGDKAEDKISANIELLLDDLSRTGDKEHSKRNVIDPPYLQIVCRRVWDRENGNGKFLSSYKQGDAEAELERYTREKLVKMPWGKKVIFSKALAHLAGAKEAKKFKSIGDLAREIRTKDLELLEQTLNGLRDSDVAILALKGTEYGLYHDMYAPLLWKWREEQLGSQQKRKIVWWSGGFILASLVLYVLLVAPYLELTSVAANVASPRYGDPADYTAVLRERNDLSRLFFWRPKGDAVWRDYNKKLATLAAFNNDNDAAALYELASLSLDGNATKGEIRKVAASELQLLATIPVPSSDSVVDAIFHSASEHGPVYMLAGTTTGQFIRIPAQGIPTRTAVDLRNQPSVSIRLLSLEAGAAAQDSALIAWLTRHDDSSSTECPKDPGSTGQFDVHVGRFSVSTGNLIGQDEARICMNSSTPPQQNQSQTTDTFSLPVDVLLAFSQLQAVFGPGHTEVAISVGNDLYVSRPSEDRGSSPEHISTEGVVPGALPKIEFLNDHRLAVAYSGIVGRDATGGVCVVDTLKPVCKLDRTFDLPSKSRFVVRKKDNRLLLKRNGQWCWVRYDNFAGKNPADDERCFSEPTHISDFSPQGLYEDPDIKNDVLIAVDIKDRILLLTPDLEKKSESLKEPNVMLLASSEPRTSADVRPSLGPFRRFTDSSVQNLPKRLFVTVEGGTSLRVWEVPQTPLPPTTIVGPSPFGGPPDCDQAKPVTCTFQRKGSPFRLRLSKVLLEVDGGQRPWQPMKLTDSINIEPPKDGGLVSTTGKRALVFASDAVLYAWQGDDGATNSRCYKSGPGLQVAFGPGEDRVTFLSDKSISVHQPKKKWPDCEKDGAKDFAPGPEWRVPVAPGLKFLQNPNKEDGVVFYSERWAHRLTIDPHSDWPNVSSVFFPHAVLGQLEEVPEDPKGNPRAAVRLPGLPQDDPKYREAEFGKQGEGSNTARRLWGLFSSPRALGLCDDQDSNDPLDYPLVEGETIPGDERKATENQSNTTWHDVMCQIVKRTHTRVGEVSPSQ
jgi:hypothetical protein